MTPQARQQLQQLTPQMRYVVLQRILQQQEANMQSQNQTPSQASNVPVSAPSTGPAMNAVPANQRVAGTQQPMGNWQNEQQQQQQQQPHPQQQQQQPQMIASQMAQQTVRPFGATQILANQLNQGKLQLELITEHALTAYSIVQDLSHRKYRQARCPENSRLLLRDKSQPSFHSKSLPTMPSQLKGNLRWARYSIRRRCNRNKRAIQSIRGRKPRWRIYLAPDCKPRHQINW